MKRPQIQSTLQDLNHVANDRGLQELFNDMAAPWLDNAMKTSCTAAATHHAAYHVNATAALHSVNHDLAGTVYPRCNPVNSCDKGLGNRSGSAAKEEARVAHAKPTVVEPGMALNLDPFPAPGEDESPAPECALDVRPFPALGEEIHDDEQRVPGDIDGKDHKTEQHDTPRKLDDLFKGELPTVPWQHQRYSADNMIWQGQP